MKKFIIATLAAVVLLGFAGSSFALLCASDPVPAGTLLFPFCTAKYDAAATATDPKVDYNGGPVTYFAITNVSASARIVHMVLWNDMSFPLLDWDVLLTGYDVITFNFGRILEGYLVPTGPATNPATGRIYSPTGTQPIAQGPVPSYFLGIPSLPVPQGVGTTANNTSSIFGLCTNPTYTVPYTIDPGRQANRIISGNLTRIFNGMRQSQRMAENGWWGSQTSSSGGDYLPPDWLLARSTSDNVWGYITADVVTACGLAFPTTNAYFQTWAVPQTTARYANNPAVSFFVDMGNTLMGDWFVIDQAGNAAQGNPAVHIEMDNQDVANNVDADGDLAVDYPKAITPGRSFYRYSGMECHPAGETDDLSDYCHDYYTGTGQGTDYVTAADYFFGPRSGALSYDYREPLPSAFAFRWMLGGGFDGGTKLRVWKEIPDILPFYGFSYVYSSLQYSYYAWDEEEHVITVTGGCDYSPCANRPPEINQLPLEVQEVDVDVFQLPKTYMTFGWALFAFLGSNTLIINIPNGYSDPIWAGYGTQAWFEVTYTASGRFSVDFNAAIIGNYLCDGLAVTASPRNGWEVTDLGDVLY